MGRGVWELSVPSARFCCELKIALKNKVKKEVGEERKEDQQGEINRARKQRIRAERPRPVPDCYFQLLDPSNPVCNKN